jgi:hypothetical protein
MIETLFHESSRRRVKRLASAAEDAIDDGRDARRPLLLERTTLHERLLCLAALVARCALRRAATALALQRGRGTRLQRGRGIRFDDHLRHAVGLLLVRIALTTDGQPGLQHARTQEILNRLIAYVPL